MAMGFFDQSDPDSYDSIQRKRKLAELLIQRGSDTSPVQHWTQGLARLANALSGNLKEGQADDAEKAQTNDFMRNFGKAYGLGGDAAPAASPAPSGPLGVSYAGGDQPAPTPPANIPNTGTSPTKDAFVAQMMPHAMRVSQETGLDPRVVIAQAALESGYGKSAPGGNYFGIKSHGAPGGQTLATNEVINGQNVRMNDSFRTYEGGMGESAMGYADFLKKNPRYAPMLQAQGMDAQIAALAKSGYATDPQYGAKIASIARSLPMANPAVQTTSPAQMGAIGYAPDNSRVPLDASQAITLATQGGQGGLSRLPDSAVVPPAPGVPVASREGGALAYTQPGAPTGAPQAELTPDMLQAYAQRQGMVPDPAPDPAGGASLAGAAPSPDVPASRAVEAGNTPTQPDMIAQATAARAANPRPGDTQIPLGPNGQLPPGAERLLGALEGSPEARSMAPATGPQAAPADRSKMLLMMAMDPRFSPQQRQMAMQAATTLQAQDKPMVLQEGASLVKPDGRGGYTTIAGGGPKQTNDQRNYEAAKAGGFQGSFTDYVTQMKRAGATNIGIDTKGQAGMQTKAIEGFETAMKAGTDANRRIASYGQMTEAMKGFTPGATAEGRIKAKSILKDMGIIEGTDVPDAEAFKRVQRQLEIQATPKGQGQITENERVLIREMIPQIGNSPEGIAKIIGQLKQLDDYDLKVAKIYRDNAHKNGGVPNFLEVSDEVASLGPPMTDAQMASLKGVIAPKPQQGGGDPLSQARDAIAKGAPRDAVIKRLRENGHSVEGL